MKLRQLALLLLFVIPQVTLAQMPGVLSERIACRKAPDQTYALYLPKSYSQSKPTGLIVFFEPAARGRLPVGLYREIADKYSIILACSNNSQNGPIDISLRAGNAVLEDVLSKFNVDRKFIIASGFSGGARTAVDMAGRDRTITGVIACGGAFSRPDAIRMEKPIPFAEVIGTTDMNYQEALGASEYLRNIHNPAFLTFFTSGHQWPFSNAYEDAVAWHLFRTRENGVEKKEFASKQLARAQVQIDSGNLFEASRILRQMLGNRPIDSLYAILMKDRRTRVQQKETERIDAMERQKQQQFYYGFTRHLSYAAPDSAFHPDFWINYRKDCEKMIGNEDGEKNGVDLYKQQAGYRLIDYGWRLCSEQHYFFLGDEQYRQAAMTARIWTLLSPFDSKPCLQAGLAFAYQHRKPETLDYLKQAVARGFKDQKMLEADPVFNGTLSSNDIRSLFR